MPDAMRPHFDQRGNAGKSPDENAAAEETFTIDVVVVALMQEFHQARVEDSSGRQYAITRKTVGLDLGALQEGQPLRCVVSLGLSRVIAAEAVKK